jgi:hypothetical protein
MQKDMPWVVKKITNPETWKLKGEKMNFNAIIGNPPYQLEGGSGGSNDSPIYQFFADLANKVSYNYISLIMPSRWFAAGREHLLGAFRNEMINNKSLQKLCVFSDGSDVFTNVEIKGGICYYCINKSYSGACEYVLHENSTIEKQNRNLSDFEVIIRNPKLSEIVKKVCAINTSATVDTIISNDTPFGISSNPKSSKKNPLSVYNDSSDEHNVQLFHIEKLVRKVEYVDRNLITKNKEYIDKYKVFIPGAAGSGNDAYVLGKPIFAPKNSVCSQSFLFAAFDDEIQAKNFIKYLYSKFLRALVSSIKISQSGPNRVYRFVPVQDFTENSDIDWSKSVAEIDAQLYKKYNLTPDEITFIETMIKPME